MSADFVVIVPPALAINLARQCNESGVAIIRKEADGVHVIQIVNKDLLESLDWETRRAFRELDGQRFKVVERIVEPERKKLVDNGYHMGQLRKRTGQDWRGYR